jgi:pimeloyl-ACP methyl ester carboxylesterase
MADQPTVLSGDGTPIVTWRSGHGLPLVLVHGTAADHSRWAPVLPAFGSTSPSSRWTAAAGLSGDAVDYALDRESEDVVAVVEAAGEDVNLLGHSHGGVCALEAALLTKRIHKLVLYEPPVGFLDTPPHVVERLQTCSTRTDETNCWRSSWRRWQDFPRIRSR